MKKLLLLLMIVSIISLSQTAEEYYGKCNLRFDDTNPIAADKEYVESIKKDIRWVGVDLKDRIFFASDYFDDMYQYAISLINNNLAYVCDLTNEEIKDMRGTLTTFGKESPFRNRSIDENLNLFQYLKIQVFFLMDFH